MARDAADAFWRGANVNALALLGAKVAVQDGLTAQEECCSAALACAAPSTVGLRTEATLSAEAAAKRMAYSRSLYAFSRGALCSTLPLLPPIEVQRRAAAVARTGVGSLHAPLVVPTLRALAVR